MVVMTFDPHPREYFRAGTTPRLTTTTTRFFALRECGVDIMLSLKFNAGLAATDAEAFVRQYLVERLKVKYLLVGDDICRAPAQSAPGISTCSKKWHPNTDTGWNVSTP